MVAPYWTDIDNQYSNVSSVSYEVHVANSSESEPAVSLLDEVSAFVSEWLQAEFEAEWMLLAEWSQVPQWKGLLSQVCHNSGICTMLHVHVGILG